MKIYNLNKPMLNLINELKLDGIIKDYNDMVIYKDNEFKGLKGDENIDAFADEYAKNWKAISILNVERYYVGDVYVGNGDSGLDLKKLILAFQKYNIKYEV